MSKAKAVITLTFLLIFTISTQAQVVPDVHPVYIANLLTTIHPTDEMIEICRYYKLTEIPSNPGYIAFSDTKGNIIRFTDNRNTDNKNPDRIIELKVQESVKMIDRLLRNTGYTKCKDGYVKGSPYADRKTVCTLTSCGKYKILSFIKRKNVAMQNKSA